MTTLFDFKRRLEKKIYWWYTDQ